MSPASKPTSGQVATTLHGELFVEPDMSCLDMGIWSDDGTVWLPKRLYPTRSLAKKFAVEFMGAHWLDVRCRTSWMAMDAEHDESGWYIKALPGVHPGAFECWELYS